MAVFWRKIWSALLFFVTLHCQREGKAVVARDRLSQLWDSLIREIISCIKGPYQLYKLRYLGNERINKLTTINNLKNY